MGEMDSFKNITQASFVVNIPKERVGVLIGEGGNVKNKLEQLLGVKLFVDSREGTVVINLSKPPGQGGDPTSLFKARDIITAIARGFPPEKAFKLAEDDYVLSVIDLTEYVGDNYNHLTRVKARIIGSMGKTRRIIEETCQVYVSVYGDTVSVIGGFSDVKAAEEAVKALADGAPHGAVYRMLNEHARLRKTGGLYPPR
ncbi:MAG: KH domain-containing protein [Candidatus Caldarchaeum sp.]|nr:KH domain-containing protein [Candidatus Caldarchaeum sp.]MDW8359909.1 KH domain-containing protein [Candidatus Caldarchaeum sp.]